MYTIYVLKDENDNLYKGLTNNLNRRLREHRAGKTQTTRKMKSVKLIYKEEFIDFKEARKRELYFKTAAGRRFIKKQVNLGP